MSKLAQVEKEIEILKTKLQHLEEERERLKRLFICEKCGYENTDKKTFNHHYVSNKHVMASKFTKNLFATVKP